MKLFPDKQRKEWNNDLRELTGIMEDIQRAKNAKVPGVEQVEESCAGCLEAIGHLKKAYFPNKP